jgi:hypothetical protein
MRENRLDFKAINERICTLQMKTKLIPVTIINVHVPKEEKEEKKKDEFYQK